MGQNNNASDTFVLPNRTRSARRQFMSWSDDFQINRIRQGYPGNERSIVKKLDKTTLTKPKAGEGTELPKTRLLRETNAAPQETLKNNAIEAKVQLRRATTLTSSMPCEPCWKTSRKKLRLFRRGQRGSTRTSFGKRH